MSREIAKSQQSYCAYIGEPYDAKGPFLAHAKCSCDDRILQRNGIMHMIDTFM